MATVEDEPPVVEAPVHVPMSESFGHDDFEPEPLATCPDCGNELQSSMHWEECLRQLGDVEPETAPELPAPDPCPTQPDLKQAAKVAPLVTFEEWQKDFAARVERDLAEIRGVK